MPYLVEPVVDTTMMTQAPQPTIEIDDELRLRPFVDHDADTVMRAFAVPDIQRWHSLRVDDLDETHRWIDRIRNRWSAGESADFAIADRTTMLGRCALHVDVRRGIAEVAYWVLPESRRRGVAVQAAIAATEWAHSALGVHRVLLQHSTANAASCAVATRAGFVAEGTARQQDLLVDGWHDMHQHSHLATDDQATMIGLR